MLYDREMTQESRQTYGQAQVIGARLLNKLEADSIRLEIEKLGYDPREISYITDAEQCAFTFDEPGSHSAARGLRGGAIGVAFGAVIGAVVGVMATGNIFLFLPIGAGIAGIMGALAGVLLGAAMNSDLAQACEDAVKSGGLVMAVQTHAGDEARVYALLAEHIIALEADVYFSK